MNAETPIPTLPLPATFLTARCDTCGAPATFLGRDSVEGPPDGDVATFRPGPRHAWCAEHRQPLKTIHQDGTVTEEAWRDAAG